MKGKVVSVNLSSQKGESKQQVREACLEENSGLKGDAHQGTPNRQVSLLSVESITRMKEQGFSLKPGELAENITFSDLPLKQLTPGKRLKIGEEVLLEITQIGKECHTGCAIFKKVGSCIMPREGIFAQVIKGGKIVRGMEIVLLP